MGLLLFSEFICRSVHVTVPSGYTKDYLMTTRYWISMTIAYINQANLPRELMLKMQGVNEAIDDVVFRSENGYTKWARAMIPK